jgi:hypothetical protein
MRAEKSSKLMDVAAISEHTMLASFPSQIAVSLKIVIFNKNFKII